MRDRMDQRICSCVSSRFHERRNGCGSGQRPPDRFSDEQRAVSAEDVDVYAPISPARLDSHEPKRESGSQSLLRETRMRWYHYVAYFFGGAFLANTLPHLGNGISGHPFQSPFASPPGEGLSSSTVNVLWGLLNLAIGYLLVCRVGKFELRNANHVVVLGVGVVTMSIMLARALGRFHGGL